MSDRTPTSTLVPAVLVLSLLGVIVGLSVLGPGLPVVIVGLPLLAGLLLVSYVALRWPVRAGRVLWWWLRLGDVLRASSWPVAAALWATPAPGGAHFYVVGGAAMRRGAIDGAVDMLGPKLGGIERVEIEPTGAPSLWRVGIVAESPLRQVVERPALGEAKITDLLLMLGRDEAGRDVTWDLADTAGHLVVQGETRSGKSVFIYNLLMQLAHRSEVAVAGVDPTGILARPWSGCSGPGWVTGTGDMAAVADHLDGLVRIMDDRIVDLVATKRDKIEGFSAVEKLLVVVLEEYAGILAAAKMEDGREGRKPADRVATRIESAVGRLVAEGAKAGIRVMIILQRADAAIMGGAMRSNVAIRITLRVDNPDAVRMLHPGADPMLLDEVQRYAHGVGLIQTPAQPQVSRFRAPYVEGYDAYVLAVEVGQTLTGGAP